MREADQMVAVPPAGEADDDLAELLLDILKDIELAGEEVGRSQASRRADTKNGFWFKTAEDHFFRIARLSGQDQFQLPERIDEALAALDRAAPLLDALEARIGIALEPTDLAELPLGRRVQLAIEWSATAFDVQHRIELALGSQRLDAEALARRRTALPASPDSLSVVEITLSVSHLEMEEAAELDIGDVLLVNNPVPARLFWPAGTQEGLFDPTSGRLSAAARPDSEAATNGDQNAFLVPLSMSLPKARLTLGQLAGLKDGNEVTLAPLLQGDAVTLSVGGRAFATGEWVKLGDQCGILLQTKIEED